MREWGTFSRFKRLLFQYVNIRFFRLGNRELGCEGCDFRTDGCLLFGVRDIREVTEPESDR